MQVASYFASLSFKVDNRELRKVDNFLKKIEYKLSKATKTKLKIDFTNFGVDQKKLNLTLGSALDKASNSVTFEITKFVVNQTAMQAAIARASRNMVYPMSGVGRSGNTIIHNRVLGNAEWDRREAEKQRLWWERRNALREDEARRAAERASRPRSSSFSSNSSTIFGAGGTAGLAARMYTPALAIAAGGYGVGAVSRRSQEITSAELGINAVVHDNRGKEAMKWLKSEADRVGFGWLDMAPSFTGFMGSAQGTMGYDKALETFKAFNEFATTRHAPNESRKRALYGLQQMASMPNVMSQELFLQIGEAQGFGEVPMLFAKAWAEKTGSGLQGKEALYELKKAMKRGEVKTADVLSSVTNQLSALAAPTLAMSARSSQAEQNRWKNALNAQVSAANESGVESGYSRLWRSLTVAMKESTPVVQSMAKAFDEISKYVSFGLMLPQSIKRAFEGRDSWFGDTYGPETVENLKSFVEGMGQIFDEMKKIASTVTEGWSMLLPSLVAIANKIKDVFLYTLKMFNALLPGGEGVDAAANYGRAMQASMAGKSPEEVAAIAAGKDFVPNVKDPFGMAFSAASNYDRVDAIAGGPLLEILARRSQLSDFSEEYRLARQAEVKNKSSIYYNDPKGFDQMVADRMKAASFDSQYYAQKASVNSTVTIASGAIVINTAATDAEGIAKELQPHLKKMLDTDHTERVGAALLMYSQKE